MPSQPIISSYAFGRIEIDGQSYTTDVIILPTAVVPNWWRKEGHNLAPEDLGAVFEASPEILVVGQGANGLMSVPEETLASISQAGFPATCLPTGKAVEAYNNWAKEGKPVAAALHLTC